MTQKAYVVRLDSESAEALRFLAEKTGRTQINVIRELLKNMVQLAISYEDGFNYVVQQNGFSEVQIVFFGKSKMISGKVTIPENSLSERAKTEIPEKILKLDIEEKLAKKDVKA